MVHLISIIIYLAFISLGLPDSLLGAAWPSMYGQFNVPVSYAGIVSTIISLGTVISSLNGDRLTKKFTTGKLTAVSVAVTAVAIFGFSISTSFWHLCFWAIPYGLGAGCVDAALNNYAALHYSSKHMSWLHCMWGVGTIAGPYLISYGLTQGYGWNFGYRSILIVQIILTVLMIISQPIWKKQCAIPADAPEEARKPIPLKKVVRFKGAKEIMLTFFCYCSIEQTAMVWSCSYMVLNNGMSEEVAANYASLFFIGITAGRAINGFIAMKFEDDQMIRIGQAVILLGIVAMMLPFGDIVSLVGLLMIGLGCAPIYPCIIHSTPEHFGADKSQAIVGVQMASAYVGNCIAPPVFGLIVKYLSVSLYPVFMAILLVLMVIMHELLMKKLPKQEINR